MVTARMAEILRGDKGTVGWPLSDEGCRLLRIIAWHKGARNPITIERIRKAMASGGVEMAEREVKALVKSLVEDYGLPIGASRGGRSASGADKAPCGYFICVTADDVELAVRPLIAEVRSLARRIRALAGAHRFAELMGQLSLEFAADQR